MNLNDPKIVVAIENAVSEQVEASGFTGELHRLDGEKIIDVILQQIEGFVLVPGDQFESLSEFKELYKRAIINAKKRKGQLNWAHVAGLGVGSGRAIELCKILNIDPCATNMYVMIEAQEQGDD